MPILDSLDIQFNPNLPLWSKFRLTLSEELPLRFEQCSIKQLTLCLEWIQKHVPERLQAYKELIYHIHYLILIQMLKANSDIQAEHLHEKAVIIPPLPSNEENTLFLESLSTEESFSLASPMLLYSPPKRIYNLNELVGHIQDYSHFLYVLQHSSSEDYRELIGIIDIKKYLPDYRQWRHLLETIAPPQRLPLVHAFVHYQYPTHLDNSLFTLIYTSLQNTNEVMQYLYAQKDKITPIITEQLCKSFLEYHQYEPQITNNFFHFLMGSYAAAFPSKSSLLHVVPHLPSLQRIRLMHLGKQELTQHRSTASFYGYLFCGSSIEEQQTVLLALPHFNQIINNVAQLHQLFAFMHLIVSEQFIETHKEAIADLVQSFEDLQLLSLYIKDFHLTQFFITQFDLAILTNNKLSLAEMGRKLEHHFFKALLDKINEQDLFPVMIETLTDITTIFRYVPLCQSIQLQKILACIKHPINSEEFVRLFQWIDTSIQAHALSIYFSKAASELHSLTISQLASIQWSIQSQKVLAKHLEKPLLTEIQYGESFQSKYPLLNKYILLSRFFNIEISAHRSTQQLSILCASLHKAAINYHQQMKTSNSGFFSCCGNDKKQNFIKLHTACQWLCDILTNETTYSETEFKQHVSCLRDKQEAELDPVLDELELLIEKGVFNNALKTQVLMPM